MASSDQQVWPLSARQAGKIRVENIALRVEPKHLRRQNLVH